jgi:hypothetical protein
MEKGRERSGKVGEQYQVRLVVAGGEKKEREKFVWCGIRGEAGAVWS